MKVAIAGTAGLAQNIARAVHQEGHEVLVLSRFLRPELAAKGFYVICVDYSKPDSLRTALTGVHTVISTVSGASQLALIDSCLTARVRRFAPAEFEGVPFERPFIESGREKIAALDRLRQAKETLQSTAFCCGIFYEWFSPGGLSKSGVIAGATTYNRVFIGDEGSYLLDFKNGKATIPAYNEGGGEAYACFTAAEDVGKFVAKCLSLESWPEQLKMCGERLKLLDLVTIAESVKGCKFDLKILSSEELNDQLIDADMVQEWKKVSRIEAFLGAQRGEYDFDVANVNTMFPEVKALGLKEWLRQAWSQAA